MREQKVYIDDCETRRLPIVQGATFAFLSPVFSILNLPQWKCPSEYVYTQHCRLLTENPVALTGVCI